MESANSHRHQLQDQIVGSSSCSLATPSCYGVGTTSAHAWTPSILNTTGFSTSHANETILNSREIRMQENTPLISSQYSSMSPYLGFHWVNTAGNFTLTNQSTQDLQHSRIKEELSDQYYRRYNEILSSSSPSSNDELLSRSEQGNLQPDDLSTKLLLKSLSSGNLMDKIHLSPGDLYANNGGRVGVSQIFPSVNIPNLNQTGSTNPGSLDMNLEALDLLASSRFSGNFGPSSQNQIGPLRDDFSNYGFGQMQQSHQIPLYCSSEASASSNGGAEAKRSSTKMEPKAPLQGAPKKSRLETRTACPPFKVRKEKLGDRIAALQQLVAPFGKTDTASVLMEAIGYIKFLQNQIETLSVPYMKASRNKPTRAVKGGGRPAEIGNCEEDAAKRDLKSRGLCLVPLSCLSYIADGGGAVVWPPPHFGGATQLVTQRR